MNEGHHNLYITKSVLVCFLLLLNSKLRALNVWLRVIRREPQNEGPKPEEQFPKNPKAVRTSRDQRLQWKMDHLKMYFLDFPGVFHSYVRLPEGLMVCFIVFY